MAPGINSRYRFCDGVRDDRGRLWLTTPEPYRYRALVDNRQHPVLGGDTLWALARRYFPSFGEDARHLWWVISDFQPTPIVDPTLRLDPARVLIIPAERVVREDILSELRRYTVGG